MAKRGRKPGAKRKGYFYEREEQAVVDYLQSTDPYEKEQIFNTIIHPAFVKMVSSIIRRYQLFIPEEEYEETFNDTMSFLILKLKCFDPTKGFKAYSYFGTVCKHYLQYRRSKHTKLKQRFEVYEELNEGMNQDLIYSPDDTDFQDEAPKLITLISQEIRKMIANREKYELTDSEVLGGNAMCEAFDHWSEIIEEEGSNKLNKSAVLYFLREQTNMSTKEFRDSTKKFNAAYDMLKKNISDYL